MECALPDGRVLVVGPYHTKPGGGSWVCYVSDDDRSRAVGSPLNSTIAEALGYDVAEKQWPHWIDDLASAIEEQPRPKEIRLADPAADEGFEIRSHDYRVVFWTEKPAEHVFASLEYDVLGAQDVHEVIEWADSEAGPYDCYTLLVKFESPWSDEHGWVQLAGFDPSVQPDDTAFRRRLPLHREDATS